MFRVVIDEPKPISFRYPIEYFRGWIRTESADSNQLQLPAISICIAGNSKTWTRIIRTDLPHKGYIGFAFFCDLREHLDHVFDGKLKIIFSTTDSNGKEEEAVFIAEVQEAAFRQARNLAEIYPKLVERIRDIICCPVCKSGLNEFEKTFICVDCGRMYNSTGFQGINLLNYDDVEPFRLANIVGRVSAHHYSGRIIEFINNYHHKSSTEAEAPLLLDCGAGLRKLPLPNIVNLDIFDYPSTHVLGSATQLPFKDNVFDAVLSFAVLEHVEDPFYAAGEIIRVLKPGGRVFCGVPFLQPEHGYPHHFFNMTRSGLRRLFEPHGKIIEQHMDGSNLPINMLYELITKYRAALPQHVRTIFTNMTIKEFLSVPPKERLTQNDPIAIALDPEWQWKLASATRIIVEK